MIGITIITVGSLKEDYLKAGVKEYIKRISAYAKLNMIEISDKSLNKNPSQGDIQKVLDQEGLEILKKIKSSTFVVTLEIDGDMMTSDQFAKFIEHTTTYNSSEIVFVIGGSWGISREVKQRSNKSLSLSSMTFPHQLTRMIFLEQLYRAFTIINNEPYHK
ncbi:MAG TPA: 23S rRNA (pseudouridine(1915)-N(3))-methyltransferase RlmH [Candidatus Izemoplasmatales bacterium]|nr:23S rRNA (pseudouridine(1915)-N(3))-methyltransferase RlmH [Candidatus Izemoplasmatales bacterium]